MRNFILGLGAFLMLGFASSTHQLRELATGYETANQVFQGSTPSTSGQIPCSTSATAADWTSPNTCGIAPAANNPSTNEPLCGTSISTAAFESAASCDLAPSTNSASMGAVLCGTGAGTAAFELPGTCDVAVSSNTPSAAGEILCSTASSNAAFFTTDAPTTKCDIQKFIMDEGSSSTTSPSILGWDTSVFTSGTAMQLRMGDNGGLNLLSAFSDKEYIFGYHGIVLMGGRNATTLPTPATGGGAGDYSVEIASSSTGALKLDGASTSSSTITATAFELSATALAPVVTANGSGGTTVQQGIEANFKAFASSTSATFAFSPAYTTNAPVCTCTNTTSTNTVKCSATTSTLTLTEATASSDNIAFICIGHK